MKMAIARGMVIKGSIPRPSEIAMRAETTGAFRTLSLSNDKDLMLQIVVTPEVKKILKEVIL